MTACFTRCSKKLVHEFDAIGLLPLRFAIRPTPRRALAAAGIGRVGGAGGSDQLVMRRVGLTEAQILLDRVVEEIGGLRHHRDQPAQRLGVEGADVLPADPHRAFGGIVQPQ